MTQVGETAPTADDRVIAVAGSHIRQTLDSGRCPQVTSFFDEATFTATHVAYDRETKRTAIIDPVLDFDPAAGHTTHASADAVANFVTELGLRVDWLLETHAHADHLSAAAYLQERLGGTIAIGHDIVTTDGSFAAIDASDTALRTQATAMPILIAALGSTVASTTNFTPLASIFLPRYSGVRPTMSPAMNTVKITKSTMP